MSIEDNELDDGFDDVFEEETKRVEVRYGSVEWSDYVMSRLEKDEKDDKGRPKCDGLRRVINELFDVVSSQATNIFQNNDETVVNWELTFVPHSVYAGQSIATRTYSALASASNKNTKHPFSNFMPAVADTRAEARCYRKALLLKCLASEEVELEEEEVGEATGAQNAAMNIMMKRLNIDLDKFLNHHKTDIAPKMDKRKKLTIDQLDKSAMSSVMCILNKYQSNTDVEVPEEILGTA